MRCERYADDGKYGSRLSTNEELKKYAVSVR